MASIFAGTVKGKKRKLWIKIITASLTDIEKAFALKAQVSIEEMTNNPGFL